MKNLTAIIGRTLVATMFLMATPAWGQVPPVASSAPAAPVTPGQALFESGKKAVADERWPDAVKMFTESYKLEPQPRTAAWLGRAQVESGDYVTGAANLELYLQEEKQPPEKMKEKVLEMLTRAKEKIVTVKLTIKPSDATVSVDKLPIDPKHADWPIYLLPGGHSFDFKKPGFDTFSVQKMYKPGEADTINADLQALVVENGKKGGVPPLAIAGFAVSGGLLVTAAITGIVANVANGKAYDAASDFVLGVGCKTRSNCEPIYNEQYGRSTTFSVVALASLGVGVGVGVASLIYTLRVPKASDTANAPKMSWIALPTPGGIVVQGAW